MKPKLMQCGHSPNAIDQNGNWVCAICVGVIEGWNKPQKSLPLLKERKAICVYCGRKTDSDFDLPFFEYQNDLDHDTYYCGCKGWD